MRVVTRLIIAVGLIMTFVGNLATVFGLHKAVNGMASAESSGIGAVVEGTYSAYFWSHVGLVGCFVLIIGLAVALLMPQKPVGSA